MVRIVYSSSNLSGDTVDEYKGDLFKMLNKHKIKLNTMYPIVNPNIQGQLDLLEEILKILKK